MVYEPSLSKNVSDVRLILWTRKSPIKYHTLKIGDVADLSVSHYNRSNPTKILIHGFSDEGLTGWVKTFKKNYFQNLDVNVISVDWQQLAKSPWYTTTVKNSKYICSKYLTIRHIFCTFFVSSGEYFKHFPIFW